jgi:Holliday junction resolvase RusA-like endonuclease
MTGYSFTVHGTPAPQGSKHGRPIWRGSGANREFTGKVAQVESSKKVAPWREAVKASVLAQEHEQLLGPVRADIVFWFQRPKYHYRTGRNDHLLRDDAPEWMDKKPDIDKCVRSTLDALKDSGVLRDDSQVVELNVSQRYIIHSRWSPGADIELRPVDVRQETLT